MNASWTLIVAGCGTVGYHALLELIRHARLIKSLSRLVLCDPAKIRDVNAITCPGYQGYAGRFKCDRLADLVRHRLGATILNKPCLLEKLRSDLGPDFFSRNERYVIMGGLDRWEARINLSEDARRWADATGITIPLLLVGLDRGLSSISVLGSRRDDPCPACGLGPGTLPETQPCVVFSAPGELLRGNLQVEAKAAARQIIRIIDGLLGSGPSAWEWMNRKINLSGLDCDHPEPVVEIRTARRVEGCFGPHGPTPILWDDLLKPESREVDHERI